MKKTKIALAISLMVSSTAFASSFVNGGFENGDLSGWTGGGGSWTGSPAAPVPPSTYNAGAPNNTLMTGGADPYTGASRVYGGSYSVRLNDNVNNYSVSTLRQAVTGYTDPNIYFAWNAVLQSSHGLTNSDYFSLVLHDDTANVDVVSRAYSSAGSIGAGTTGVTWTCYGTGCSFGGGVWSSGWVVESIDTSGALNGHDFTLTMLASDCPYGGHWGYAYLDGFGAAPPQPTPEPETLALLGLGLLGLGAARRRKRA